MLLQLSKNTFVRTYGPYTYILDRLHDSDRIFRNAEPFMRHIGRVALDKEEILKRIMRIYAGADASEVRRDFDRFMKPLIEDGLILAGETVGEVHAKERFFAYSDREAKTASQQTFLSKDEVERTPHIVLGNYFQENNIPMRLHMDVTQACTERCIHCYMPEYNPIFLPFDKIAKVIDEFRALDGMHITFSGGECMLHPDFAKMLRYAHDRDLTVAVLSNLTLCDTEKVKLLKEVDATVQVSLYSMDARVHDTITKQKGSWQKTKDAIERIHDANIPCFIACPTMRQNADSYYRVVEYAQSLNMSAQVDFIIMGKTNCDVSNLPCRVELKQAESILHDLLYKAMPIDSEYFSLAMRGELPTKEEWMEKPVCSAGIDSICLDATGVYYPCPGFAGFKLGNCREHSLAWVWCESPEMKRLRAIKGRDFKTCVDCPDINHCSICMCRNYNETGDIFRPAKYFCEVAHLNHVLLDERIAGIEGSRGDAADGTVKA